MKRFYKNFIVDIIIAVLVLILAIVTLPPFGIGQSILNVLLAVMLVAYLAFYLFDKVRRSKGKNLLLRVCEFTLISLIALGLVFQQFKLFNITGVCTVIGVVLWLRGVSSITGMYLTIYTTARNRNNLPKFLFCILLITLGTFLFAKPIITDEILTWIMCISFFIIAIVFVGLAILFAPAKKSSSIKKVSEPNQSEKENKLSEKKAKKIKKSSRKSKEKDDKKK